MSSTWFVPREELSRDQLRAVDLDPSEHRVILGAPGSGKTIVLLHRARQLLDNHNINPKRLRIFVFTNTLKNYIRSALTLLDLPAETVTTFDQWCREFYITFIARRVPFSPTRGPDFEAIRSAVLAALKKPGPLFPVGFPLNPRINLPHVPGMTVEQNSELQTTTNALHEVLFQQFSEAGTMPMYDAVLVDEGQDLTREAFAILHRIARHVTVCMDAKQQIYENRCDEPGILQSFGLQRSNLTFLEAYRCCPYIVKLASHLLLDPDERAAFLNQTRTGQIERLTPLLFIALDTTEEKANVPEIIRTRQRSGDRIAVLLPNNAKLFTLAKTLQKAGLEVEVPERRNATEFKPHDFTTELPKLMTYHGAKGLTFDTVIMPRLVTRSFVQIQPERLERILFVGISRATKWVYMSTVAGRIPPIIQRIAKLAKTGEITIQRTPDSLPLFNEGHPTADPTSVQKVSGGNAFTDLF